MTKLVIALDNLSFAEAKEKIKEIEKLYKDDEINIIFKVNDLIALVWFEWLFSIFQNSKAFLMLDAKYHDIENTMKNYLRQLASSKIAQKVGILTVHTSIWKKALRELKNLRDELGLKNLKILSITALTSLDDEETMELYGKNAKELVLHFAKIAFSSGIDGIVCSAQEVAMIKQVFWKDFLVLTPWVRLEKTDNTDQKRIATVEEAVENGSDYIVMGRPILNSLDMIWYIKNILNIINK
jgi:orotidine-5'-phosphate decarboxylase